MISSESPPQRAAWFLVLLVCGVVFWQQQIHLPLQNPHRNDLKHLYLGSRLLLRGENPYPYENLVAEAARVRHPHFRTLNPYVYPPFTGYFFGWLGKLSYDRAVVVWFWGSQILLVISMTLFWDGTRVFPSLPRLGILLGSLALSFPLFRATSAGQLDHFLLFCFSLTFWLWRHVRKKAAGLVLGFAALLKVQPVYLLVWLLWKREWGALGSALVTILALVLLPATVFGLTPYFDYLGILGQMRYGSSTWAEQGASFYVDPGNIGVPALLFRTLAENPVTHCWRNWSGAAHVLCVIWALFVVAVCFWCCRVNRKDEDPEMELGTWILGMLLIPSLFWDHYLVLAIPAWLVLVSRLAASGSSDPLLFLSACCWLWSGAWVVWFDERFREGWRILMLNVTLPPVLMLFVLCAWTARTNRVHAQQKLHREWESYRGTYR